MTTPDHRIDFSTQPKDKEPRLPSYVSAIRDLTLVSREESIYREVPRASFEQVPVIGSEGVSYVVQYHDGESYRVNRMDVEEVQPWGMCEDAPGTSAVSDNADAAPTADDLWDSLFEQLDVDKVELRSFDTSTALPAVPAPPSRAVDRINPTSSLARSLTDWMKNPKNLEPPQILIPNLAARGRLTLLAARQKLGKSTLCAWLLAMLSKGEELLGMKGEAVKVLWISFEESPNQVVPRFLTMGANEDNVEYVDGWEIVSADTMPKVYELIRTQQSALIVIDSLSRMAMRGGAVKIESAPEQWAPIFDEMKAAALASDSALVLLHHTAKGSDDPRGSTMITSAVDDIAVMRRMAGDDRARRIEVEGRTFRKSLVLTQTENGDGYVEVAQLDQPKSSKNQLESRIIAALAETPGLSGKALAVKLGKSKEAVYKILNDLLVLGKIERTGSGPSRGYRNASPAPRDDASHVDLAA